MLMLMSTGVRGTPPRSSFLQPTRVVRTRPNRAEDMNKERMVEERWHTKLGMWNVVGVVSLLPCEHVGAACCWCWVF